MTLIALIALAVAIGFFFDQMIRRFNRLALVLSVVIERQGKIYELLTEIHRRSQIGDANQDGPISDQLLNDINQANTLLNEEFERMARMRLLKAKYDDRF